MIDLYFCATPNCWKVCIILEEVGLPYNVIPIDIMEGDQLTPEFGKISLNHKVPVIIDHAPLGDGAPFTVFESGAILLYLAEKTEAFLPSNPKGRSLVIQWLIWQVAGLGPMYGQSNHFIRYARERHEYSIARYGNEALRLTHVLENRLSVSEYLADDYSIADMAIWPWLAAPHLFSIDLTEFPNVQRWHDAIRERPAVQRALTNKVTAPNPKFLQEKAKLTNEQWSISFGEGQIAAVRKQGSGGGNQA